FTLYLAAALNLAIGAIAFRLPDVTSTPQMPGRQAAGPHIVCVAIFISGAAALMNEVGWTRVLGLVAGPTTYAFTLMLCSMIAGLALGSAAGSQLTKRYDVRTSTFAWIEILVGLASLALIAAFGRLPLWIGALVRRYAASFTALHA